MSLLHSSIAGFKEREVEKMQVCGMVNGHNVRQLNRYEQTLQRYQLEDLTGSSYLLIYNRLKEHLLKENPAVRRSKGSGSAFGLYFSYRKLITDYSSTYPPQLVTSQFITTYPLKVKWVMLSYGKGVTRWRVVFSTFPERIFFSKKWKKIENMG